jgi:uncharacterized membrane protein YtjA (UPF0391 family)
MVVLLTHRVKGAAPVRLDPYLFQAPRQISRSASWSRSCNLEQGRSVTAFRNREPPRRADRGAWPGARIPGWHRGGTQFFLGAEGESMLYWALVFFVFALVAAILGFGGIAIAAAGIAKILFFVFLVLFVVSLIANFARRADRAL